MPIGAGLFPAGLYPAGYGVPDSAPAPAQAALPDPTTGLQQTGRLINQKTGDYVTNANGSLAGMTTVEQLVLLAILNIDTSTLQEKGPSFPRILRALVTTALADLVTQKLVKILQVNIVSSPGTDTGIAVCDWIDLTTNAFRQTPIG